VEHSRHSQLGRAFGAGVAHCESPPRGSAQTGGSQSQHLTWEVHNAPGLPRVQLVQFLHLWSRQHFVLRQKGHRERHGWAASGKQPWSTAHSFARSAAFHPAEQQRAAPWHLLRACVHVQHWQPLPQKNQQCLTCSADRKSVGSALSCFSRGTLSQWLRTRKLQGLVMEGLNARTCQACARWGYCRQRVCPSGCAPKSCRAWRGCGSAGMGAVAARLLRRLDVHTLQIVGLISAVLAESCTALLTCRAPPAAPGRAGRGAPHQ